MNSFLPSAFRFQLEGFSDFSGLSLAQNHHQLAGLCCTSQFLQPRVKVWLAQHIFPLQAQVSMCHYQPVNWQPWYQAPTSTAQLTTGECNTKHSHLATGALDGQLPLGSRVRLRGAVPISNSWVSSTIAVSSPGPVTHRAGDRNELSWPGQEDGLNDGKHCEELENTAEGREKETASSGWLWSTRGKRASCWQVLQFFQQKTEIWYCL